MSCSIRPICFLFFTVPVFPHCSNHSNRLVQSSSWPLSSAYIHTCLAAVVQSVFFSLLSPYFHIYYLDFTTYIIQATKTGSSSFTADHSRLQSAYMPSPHGKDDSYWEQFENFQFGLRPGCCILNAGFSPVFQLTTLVCIYPHMSCSIFYNLNFWSEQSETIQTSQITSQTKLSIKVWVTFWTLIPALKQKIVRSCSTSISSIMNEIIKEVYSGRAILWYSINFAWRAPQMQNRPNMIIFAILGIF